MQCQKKDDADGKGDRWLCWVDVVPPPPDVCQTIPKIERHKVSFILASDDLTQESLRGSTISEVRSQIEHSFSKPLDITYSSPNSYFHDSGERKSLRTSSSDLNREAEIRAPPAG